MMNFIPSKDDSTIAVQFDGKATKEDAENLSNFAKQKFGEDQSFNIFAIMHDIDGSTIKGMLEGMKTDVKHWNQYKKIAVVSDKQMIQRAGDLGNLLPGIETKHFEKEQTEQAWEWIKQ